ncbi:MAG: hypothetical protein JWO10_834, partial [Microbacteriaceae bacterium]|nr:hypothetical protein [Microbacteriaceae bacterium]
AFESLTVTRAHHAKSYTVAGPWAVK